MSAIPEALRRGCVDLVSEAELARKLALKRPLRVKLGVDPTSPDLHLGHTVVLSKLRAFQDAGHKAILIIGDFTAQVGDPSGRDATRPALSGQEIERNAATYKQQALKVLDPGPDKLEIRNNSEWLQSFIRSELLNVLKRHTVTQLMEREDFKKRAKEGSPITLLEILYPIFQGQDSVAVKADIELGGSDQLFNLLMGRQMQKDVDQESQVVMTLPLLVGLDGTKKMSKSYGNAVGVNEPARDVFGKIMKLSDATMWNYYELLTQHDLKKVKDKHPMDAKKDLAEEITARFSDARTGKSERDFFETTFSKRAAPTDVETFRFGAADNIGSWSQLIVKANAVKSRKEAQRLISQGAVAAVIGCEERKILEDGAPPSGTYLLRVGKHKFFKVTVGP